MNVPTIMMDKDAAVEKLQAYRADRHKDAEVEYRAVEAGYAALADGTPLIDLNKAIQVGGFDEKMRPRLAVSRADRQEVYFRWLHGQTRAEFNANAKPNWGGRRFNSLVVHVDLSQVHGQKYQSGGGATVDGFAMVPMVPADVRPAKGQLRDWHILWEVEQWSDRSLLSPPPHDPYLIQHIGGTLWAVIAEWDLTELERAVMAGTRTMRR